jgi:hypothetical protein
MTRGIKRAASDHSARYRTRPGAVVRDAHKPAPYKKASIQQNPLSVKHFFRGDRCPRLMPDPERVIFPRRRCFCCMGGEPGPHPSSSMCGLRCGARDARRGGRSYPPKKRARPRVGGPPRRQVAHKPSGCDGRPQIPLDGGAKTGYTVLLYRHEKKECAGTTTAF